MSRKAHDFWHFLMPSYAFCKLIPLHLTTIHFIRLSSTDDNRLSFWRFWGKNLSALIPAGVLSWRAKKKVSRSSPCDALKHLKTRWASFCSLLKNIRLLISPQECQARLGLKCVNLWLKTNLWIHLRMDFFVTRSELKSCFVLIWIALHFCLENFLKVQLDSSSSSKDVHGLTNCLEFWLIVASSSTLNFHTWMSTSIRHWVACRL